MDPTISATMGLMLDANKRFDVTHVSQSLSRLGGGVSRVAWELGEMQRQLGSHVAWSCLRDSHLDRELPLSSLPPRVIASASSFGPRQMPISPGLRGSLDSVVHCSDVVHIHGMWSTIGRTAGAIARKRKTPYLIAPHGMLDTWALKHRAWRKKVARWFFEERFLGGASCVHALVREESEAIRRFGYRGPIAVIPNGIDVTAFDCIASDRNASDTSRTPNNRRMLLFLGRVHPKKGLEMLLKAWKKVERRHDWCLTIAGPDENNHRRELERLARDQDIDKDVFFVDAVYGREKLDLLREAEVFVLPSHSEGFSMAVLEALACGLPVIVTSACNFSEIDSSQAGQVVASSRDVLTAAIQRFVDCTPLELRRIGENGRYLVESNYRWEKIARKMLDVYLWVMGCRSKPDCVLEEPCIGSLIRRQIK